MKPYDYFIEATKFNTMIPTHYLSAGQYLHYYMHLTNVKVINLLRHRYDKKGVVYGIRCRLTGQTYIGHTVDPKVRFYSHFIRLRQSRSSDHSQSNSNLQLAIDRYGLHNFYAYIYAVIPLDSMPTGQAKEKLRTIEQTLIDHYPKDQLYNKINSKSVI